jgi:hypothetical protein
VKVEKAREIIAALSAEDFRAATGTEG